MGKIRELLEKLCPNGVEYKRLGEIATISRGGNLQKKDFCSDGVPCIHYGQIYTRYGLFADKTFTFISEDCAKKQKLAYPNDIVMAVTSENIEDVCKCVAWLGDGAVAVSGHTAIIHHNQNAKYLTYYFHTQMFAAQKRKLVHGTKVMEVKPDTLNSVIIPVPPLPVQSEIVKILDNFTELTAELTAELTVRKLQYKYYCKKVLKEGENAVSTPIRNLGKWTGGCTPSMAETAYWANGTIPWISSKDMKVATLLDTQDHITEKALERTPIKMLPADIVAIVARSGILKHTLPVAYIPFATTVNQDIKALVTGKSILPRYAYFAIFAFSDDILKKAKKQGGTVDSLDVKAFMNYEIPVPVMEEQQRIVNILNRFDTLCNDLTSGLPAEIAARQKQYEYYRDKLLTFEERT